MVAPGGCAWLLLGGHAWLLWGAMHGCSGGCVWLLPGGTCMVTPMGACVVAPGGHVWLLWGVGACMVAPGGGGMHGIGQDTEIRSMSGWYASYWNAFLFENYVHCISHPQHLRENYCIILITAIISPYVG